MKSVGKVVLAVIIILILYIMWIGVGSALFGWTHGGGAIPNMIFFSMTVFVWRTITKKGKGDKNTIMNRDEDKQL